VWTWKDKGATLLDILVDAVVPGADEEVLEEDEKMALWSTIIPTKSPSEGEAMERCTYVTLFQVTSQLRCQFEHFQMF